MRSSLLIAMIMLGCGCVSAPQRDGSMAVEAVRQAIPLGSVPALGVVEIRGGQIVGLHVEGVRRVGSSDLVRSGDIWHLGSDAKPMTAMLVQMLVNQGKLDWSDRVADRLPNLSATNPAYRDVTLMDLATHTSGLPENADTEFLLSFYNDSRSLREQRIAYLNGAFSQPPAVVRGTYSYSNTGFITLGAVAERVTGRSYEQLMREMMFGPLGMRSAGFGATSRGQPLYHENGRAIEGPRGDNPLLFAPAGGIHMSLQDWAKWAIDQMNGETGGGKLMPAQAYRFLHQPRISRPGRDTRIAMDWGVTERARGPLLFHNGTNGGWFALIALAPATRDAILVVANGAEDMKGDVVTNRALKIVLDSWTATPAP